LGAPRVLADGRGADAIGALHATDTGGETATSATTDADRGAYARPPELTLAEVYSPGIDLSRYLVSEKLDGVRAYWDGRRLLTRGGRVIDAPHWFTAALPAFALDGELWGGRGTFDAVSAQVRKRPSNPDGWQSIRYMLFDLPDHPGDFKTRTAALQGVVATIRNKHLGLVEQRQVADHLALMTMLDDVVAAGGEGLMLHRADATYRVGRSADLLKVKPYSESQARVLEHLPGRGRHQGRMGSLLVEEADGTRFRLGNGFSDAERSAPPPVGTIVDFKHYGRTPNGVPRFASFKGSAEVF
jgi:DNA ligase-1